MEQQWKGKETGRTGRTSLFHSQKILCFFISESPAETVTKTQQGHSMSQSLPHA